MPRGPGEGPRLSLSLSLSLSSYLHSYTGRDPFKDARVPFVRLSRASALSVRTPITDTRLNYFNEGSTDFCFTVIIERCASSSIQAQSVALCLETGSLFVSLDDIIPIGQHIRFSPVREAAAVCVCIVETLYASPI